MPAVETFEILIVGGGKAGKTLAVDLARAGPRTALLERGMIGGTCINVGCIPCKALIRSAKIAELISRAQEFGIDADAWKVQIPPVLAHPRAAAAGMVDLNWKKLPGF